MSWSNIVAALVTRLQTSSGGNVHGHLRDITGGPDSEEFQCVFTVPSPDGGGQLNSWQVNRTDVGEEKTLDDDVTSLRIHKLDIQARVAFMDEPASAPAFLAAVDSVIDDLRSGDRTLGGACYSLSEPRAHQGGYYMFGDGFCHGQLVSLEVAELVANTPPAPPALPSSSGIDPFYPAAVQIQNFLRSASASFNPMPTFVGWDATMANHPLFQHQLGPGEVALYLVPDAQKRVYYPGNYQRSFPELSVWVYIGQIPGRNHSALLLAYLQQIQSLLAVTLNPAAGAGVQVMWAPELRIHPELRFKHWDDPGRRQSVGQISLKLEAKNV